jgi:hypothetical protein
MKFLLLCLAAVASVVAVTPASARIWVDAGPVAVRVGPPPPWHRHWHRHRVVEEYYVPAYAAAECRIIRERIRRPDGTRVIRERRICD